jgi:signal transduction histidine kinase
MAALRFPSTALAVALSWAGDTIGAGLTRAYIVEPEHVTCLAEVGLDARSVPATGRIADSAESAEVRELVTAGGTVSQAFAGGADWTVSSGRPIDGGYALLVYTGWGAGPKSDPDEIRDPLVLLVNHSWLSSKVKGMELELAQLREDRAVVSATLRHDLRHPIQAITAGSDLLTGTEIMLSAEEHSEFLGMINSEAHRLSRMIDEAFAEAVSSEHVPPKLSCVETTELIESVAGAVRRGWGGDIVTCVDPQTIRTDSDLLRRAMLNLVHNARKYAPVGTNIEIRGTMRGSSYGIGVVDAGPGVDAELEPFLFTPFNNDSKRLDSTGLGLVSVSRTMNRLGGRVTYSRVSDTTVFELIVPLQQ